MPQEVLGGPTSKPHKPAEILRGGNVEWLRKTTVLRPAVALRTLIDAFYLPFANSPEKETNQKPERTLSTLGKFIQSNQVDPPV